MNNNLDEFYLNLEKEKEQEQEHYLKDCRLLNEIFNHEIGEKFYNFLKKYLEYTVADPSKSSSFAYFREGQNALIRKIFFMAAQGGNLKRGNNNVK